MHDLQGDAGGEVASSRPRSAVRTSHQCANAALAPAVSVAACTHGEPFGAAVGRPESFGWAMREIAPVMKIAELIGDVITTAKVYDERD